MRDSRTVVGSGIKDEFAQLLGISPVYRELRQKGAEYLYQFPFLFQDIFAALYNEPLKLLPADATSAGAKLNRLVLEQIMKSSEFKNARRYTRQNPLGAGMAALYFAELIYRGLPAELAETANEMFVTEEEIADALLQGQAAYKIAVQAEHADKATEAGFYRASLARWQGVTRQKKRRLQTLSARLSMQWNASGKKGIAGTGQGQEGEKQGKFATGAEGVGDNKGVWATGDLTPHLQAVETYLASPKLQKLAQRVGRLKQVRELKHGAGLPDDITEVHGIAYGNDLTMVIPEEWADYFHPDKRSIFKKKFADEALCMFDMKKKRGLGAGSLIICLDNSGSMQGPKEETAKAIAVALMEIAMAQQRDFVVIMFGGSADEMKIFDIPQGRCTLEQLVEIGECFLCSAGTDFEKPLREALQYLERDKYPNGDIIFISDGVCHISPEFREKYEIQKKTKRFRTIGVMVNYGQVPQAPMEAFCDEVLWSKDLKGIDVAGALFGRLRAAKH